MTLIEYVAHELDVRPELAETTVTVIQNKHNAGWPAADIATYMAGVTSNTRAAEVGFIRAVIG